MKTIQEMQNERRQKLHKVIFNIANMRKAITGAEMDLNNLHLYDVWHMNYDELYELQNSLIPHYNEAMTKNNNPKNN